jgi:beta-glucosidase
VGFERLALGAGASDTVTFALGFAELALVDRNLEERIEPGVFDVWVGLDAETPNGAVLTVS